MATPFAFSGALSFPEAVGLPPDPIPLAASGSFTQEAKFVLALTGSEGGTQSVALGTIVEPGVKALLITVDSGSGVTPITVNINGSETGGIEVSAGGFMAVGSPSPDSGITSLDIAYTSTCTVRVWALG